MDYDTKVVWEWIDSFWGKDRRNCPICDKDPTDWVLLKKIWEMREFRGGVGGTTIFGAGQVMPVIALMCNDCGHMVLFNAIAVRAIPRRESEGE